MSESEGPEDALQGVVHAFDSAEAHYPEDGGDGAGDAGDAEPRLPEGCPVTPLGIDGDVCWYLDASRQLRDLKAKDHSQANIEFLFGRQVQRVFDYWPRYGKPVENADGSKSYPVTGWRTEVARPALFGACADCGVWDPLHHVRGRGAWTDPDGELVLHCGSAVYVKGDWRVPGRYEGKVYPTAPPVPRPSAAAAVGGEAGAAGDVLRMLRTWNWRRPEIDPYLVLGWICAAMLSGALTWRPLMWLTGDLSTGKSTLHKLIHGLFGEAIVSVTNTTAAGIWQKLRQDALPVAIDELEAEAKGDKVQAVIELARQAASGGVILRGGSDHGGAEFVAQGCFLFSSILIPPLAPQDRSRMAVCELDELAGTKPPDLSPRRLAYLGAALRRRLVDGWPELAGVIDQYRDALAAVGHKGRGCDVFGTLLGCAEIAMAWEAAPPHAEVASTWADLCRPIDDNDDDSDHKRCLLTLLTTALPRRHGEDRMVASYVQQAGGLSPVEGSGMADVVAEANDALGRFGLRVEWATFDQPGGEAGAKTRWLLVANQHSGLELLFKESHWAARKGGPGVWQQALGRVPGAKRVKGKRFGGRYARAVAVPWSAIADLIEEPRLGREAEAAAALA